MSFSADVKEELNNNLSLKNKEFLKAELLGYLISNNATINKGKKYSNISYVTENEFNIEHLYKILVNLNIAYDPEIKGKTFVALIEDFDLVKLEQLFETNKSELKKVILRGCFLGSGSINDPTKNYHAEIKINSEKYCKILIKLCEDIGLKIKKVEGQSTLYITDGNGISELLAIIGANKSVIKFEEIRTIREVRNSLNRKVNCETANINKTVNASLDQIEDIKLIIKKKKFESLTDEQKEIAKLRIEYPEATLKELGQMLINPIGKSGVNHRLQKIHEVAEELRK